MAWAFVTAVMLIGLTGSAAAAGNEHVISPADMPRIGAVDARFLSYNIEMVEVTGGRFWKSYGPRTQWRPNQNLYAYRSPIDLTNARLRKLAAALGPAYVRISGTWANATYFADSDSAPSKPPAGFNSVLTRAQWRVVTDFARAVDARIVTSLAISPGTRDASGAWMPDQARRILSFTRSLGANIAAAEYMNEPTLAAQNGAPSGYDAAAYRRDFGTFSEFIKQASPETLILGPGSVGGSALETSSRVSARDLLAASGNSLDVFSYHDYGGVSPRCGGRDSPDQALTEHWLSRTDDSLAFYAALRDRFAAGKPIWLTETADAACGGNIWDATFLDTFRYLDQLGRLARAGVQVIMHNTLSGSDYGLLDEITFQPRPNYWAALLWRRVMGRTVLDPGVPARVGLHVYAHCDAAVVGGVTVLAINTSRVQPQALRIAMQSERYTLRASRLEGKMVQLNGTALHLDENDALPRFAPVPTQAGVVTLAPASITFLAIPAARNPACL